MPHLFAYGTLAFPEVMETVTGRSFASAEGVAPGFASFLLKDRLYPGLTAVHGERCAGMIYFHVDDRSLAMLDDFEDDVYVRRLLHVNTHDVQSLEAYTYLIPPQDRHCLTPLSWQPDLFRAKHLPAYLEGCKTFHQEVVERLARGLGRI